MEEMTAPHKQTGTDGGDGGVLKVGWENNHRQRHRQHHHQGAEAAARRRRTEIRRLKVISNAKILVEPVSKRSRPCSGDLKPCFHVLTITSSSSSSSSFQAFVDHRPHDDEGEGKCIAVIDNNSNIFETRVSPSLQQGPEVVPSSATDNDLPNAGEEPDHEEEEEEEEEEEQEEEESTVDTRTTLPDSDPTLGSDDSASLSSGELCSGVVVPSDYHEAPSNSDTEKIEAESPARAALPEEYAPAGKPELLSNLDLQQSVPEIVASVDADSSNLAAGNGSSGGRGRCVADRRVPPWACAALCGWRAEMEDAVSVAPGFLSVPCGTVGGCVAGGSEKSNESSALHFFGVYDGHGGSQAANFCKDRLHHALVEEIEAAMNGESSSACGGGSGNNWQAKWEKAFVNCFRKVDGEVGGGVNRRDGDGEEEALEGSSDPVVPETVGSTAVVAVVGSCQIMVSNCGDSRAVLSRGGRAIALSVDHKPNRPDEMARIEEAGGKVIEWNGFRVFGVLAMSRAIGDRYLKPYVISDPEITFTQRMEDDECLILASDGLWDVLTNEEVCDIARRRLARGHNGNASSSSRPRDEGTYSSAQAAADHLSKLALQRNSPDNITVVVVDLKSRKRHEPRN